ncbi:MAG: hypothetical protein M3457_18245 [Chloroflexota bacterium]|nr:hypothetical protein [Chloroflexota bacterium]
MQPSRLLWASAVCLLAMGFAAILLVPSAEAQTEGTVGGPKLEETVPSGPGPTEEPTPPPTNDPGTGTGGIVVTPSPTEPTATEPVEEGEIPDNPEGVPTEERDNEGIAPAVVVVVLRTADGGSVSDRTTVCVSETCQPVGAVASGTKIEFERIVQGWHDISIVDAGSYKDGFSSVAVRPGQLHTVEVTLALSRRVEEMPPTPPPGANGPIRSPVQVADQGDAVGRDTSAQFTTNVRGSVDSSAPLIRALPATGTGEADRSVANIGFAIGAALALMLFALLTRRRAF